jgi:hypothetical protein
VPARPDRAACWAGTVAIYINPQPANVPSCTNLSPPFVISWLGVLANQQQAHTGTQISDNSHTCTRMATSMHAAVTAARNYGTQSKSRSFVHKLAPLLAAPRRSRRAKTVPPRRRARCAIPSPLTTRQSSRALDSRQSRGLAACAATPSTRKVVRARHRLPPSRRPPYSRPCAASPTAPRASRSPLTPSGRFLCHPCRQPPTSPPPIKGPTPLSRSPSLGAPPRPPHSLSRASPRCGRRPWIHLHAPPLLEVRRGSLSVFSLFPEAAVPGGTGEHHRRGPGRPCISFLCSAVRKKDILSLVPSLYFLCPTQPSLPLSIRF